MKALVWKENGRIEFEPRWPEPECGRDQVKVRVKAAGICTTDIHMVSGELDFAKPPWVLGHEFAGIVEHVGEGVDAWQAGDRVIVDPVVSCGCCRHCRLGKKYLCMHGGELGTTYGSGGYGEFVVVDPSNLYALPANMSYAEGAMMEPLNCTLGAVERIRGMAGSRCIVFGPGPAGLMFVQLAKSYGAIEVTLVGMDDARLDLGRRLGADHTINLSKQLIHDGLEGQMFDVAIEASGSVQAVGDCFEYVAASGTVALYGLHGSGRMTIDSDRIVAKDLTVVTCISAPLLWDKAIRLVQAGRINLQRIVTEMIQVDQAEQILNRLFQSADRPIKAILSHGE